MGNFCEYFFPHHFTWEKIKNKILRAPLQNVTPKAPPTQNMTKPPVPKPPATTMHSPARYHGRQDGGESVRRELKTPKKAPRGRVNQGGGVTPVPPLRNRCREYTHLMARKASRARERVHGAGRAKARGGL